MMLEESINLKKQLIYILEQLINSKLEKVSKVSGRSDNNNNISPGARRCGFKWSIQRVNYSFPVGSGDAFTEAAKLHSDKLDSRHEAANSYAEAAQVYKKAVPPSETCTVMWLSCDFVLYRSYRELPVCYRYIFRYGEEREREGEEKGRVGESELIFSLREDLV